MFLNYYPYYNPPAFEGSSIKFNSWYSLAYHNRGKWLKRLAFYLGYLLSWLGKGMMKWSWSKPVRLKVTYLQHQSNTRYTRLHQRALSGLSGQFTIGVVPGSALLPVHACLVVLQLAFTGKKLLPLLIDLPLHLDLNLSELFLLAAELFLLEADWLGRQVFRIHRWVPMIFKSAPINSAQDMLLTQPHRPRHSCLASPFCSSHTRSHEWSLSGPRGGYVVERFWSQGSLSGGDCQLQPHPKGTVGP